MKGLSKHNVKSFLKRSLTLLLAGATAVTALTGCGTKKSDASAGGDVELSVFGWRFENAAKNTDDYIYDQIKKKVGVRINPVNASEKNWEERLGILVASGDVPDVFVTKGLENKEVYNKWLEDGILLCLSDHVTPEKYPNLSRQLDKFKDFTLLQNGKHYSLPVDNDLSSSDAVCAGQAIYIRKDWLDKLGLKEPTTMEEFYNVAKAFRGNDPDGNGKQDTYGFCGAGVWWLYPFINSFNTSFEFYYKDGDQWKPECISDNMKKAASFLKKCYDEKLLDSDFLTEGSDKALENFVSGRVGMLVYNAGPSYNKVYNQFQAAYPDKNPKDVFTYLKEPLEGFDGTVRVMGGYNFWTATAIRADISEEKRDKALALLEFLCSDEGSKLCSLGEPNVDYKEENGKYISLLPNNSSGYPIELYEKDKSANFCHLVAHKDFRFVCENTQNPEDYKGSTAAFTKAAKVDPLYFVSVVDKVDSAEIKQLKDAVYQGLATLITQSDNFDADFEAYANEWKSVGGNNYTKALNEGAKKLGL